MKDEIKLAITSEFESMASEFANRYKNKIEDATNQLHQKAYPKTNIYRYGKDLVLLASVPFIKPQDLEVGIEAHPRSVQLYLRCNLSSLSTREYGMDLFGETKVEIIKSEISRPEYFYRTFQLNHQYYLRWQANGNHIESTLYKGVWTIKLLNFFDYILDESEEEKYVTVEKTKEIVA